LAVLTVCKTSLTFIKLNKMFDLTLLTFMHYVRKEKVA
jgi:hypothetical protein